jgi:hypothetical protein
MLRRILALTLALIVGWVGVASQETALAGDGASQGITCFALADPADKSDGSVDDHHLDDAPAQAGGDGAGADAIVALPPTLDLTPQDRSAVPAFCVSVHVSPPSESQYRPPRRA